MTAEPPPTTTPPDADRDALRRRTVAWVVGLGAAGLIIDGYDLVVYGAVVPVLLRDPGQIGPLTPGTAGALQSVAVLGVVVGAFIAGAVSDLVGRRKVLLAGYAWLSVGMIVTALSTSAAMLGTTRFLGCLGMGALLATTGPLVAEVVPRHRRNLLTGITFSGIAVGAMLSALLAILLLGTIGWRGMFALGALPLVTVLPLAWFHMPESPAWLLARGRTEEARAVAARTGADLPEVAGPTPQLRAVREARRFGPAGLFSRALAVATLLLGLVAVSAQVIVIVLNAWLPELMQRAGFGAAASLAFLLVLNCGGVLGAVVGSRLGDRLGSTRPITALALVIGAVAAALLAAPLPSGVLVAVVAVLGFGLTGGNLLLMTFTATYYPTSVRGAGVAWVTGIGRLGAVAGPVLAGLLLGAGTPLGTIFFILAGLALIASVVTLLVPRARDAGTGSTLPDDSLAATPSPQ